MVAKASLRLIIPLAIIQIVFLVIFGIKIQYHETARPLNTVSPTPVGSMYPSKEVFFKFKINLELYSYVAF